MCLGICDLLPATKAGQNLEYQFSKSGAAPALIYGKAQAAGSRADFLHKMKLVFKEFRINLKIIGRKPVVVHERVDIAYQESNELMAIFIKSIETAKSNNAGSKEP